MEITRDQLGKIARNLLEFIKVERIRSAEDLQDKVGQEWKIYGIDKDNILGNMRTETYWIGINLSPARFGARTYIMSYTIHGPARPMVVMQVRVNLPIDYSMIMLKSRLMISGYEKLGIVDSFNNVHQDKHIGQAKMSDVTKELEELARNSQGVC